MLDSLVLLWMLEDSYLLGHQAREIITGSDEIVVSAIAIAEIQSKSLVGRVSLAADLLPALTAGGLKHLSLTCEEAAAAGNIMVPGGDLANALLISQCQNNDYHLLTADDSLLTSFYDITIDARL